MTDPRTPALLLHTPVGLRPRRRVVCILNPTDNGGLIAPFREPCHDPTTHARPHKGTHDRLVWLEKARATFAPPKVPFQQPITVQPADLGWQLMVKKPGVAAWKPDFRVHLFYLVAIRLLALRARKSVKFVGRAPVNSWRRIAFAVLVDRPEPGRGGIQYL